MTKIQKKKLPVIPFVGIMLNLTYTVLSLVYRVDHFLIIPSGVVMKVTNFEIIPFFVKKIKKCSSSWCRISGVQYTIILGHIGFVICCI